MKTSRKPLFLMRNGEKFVHEGTLYTVYGHEGNMTEVFKNGRFWAWPSWDGRKPVIVNAVVNIPEHVTA